MIMEQEKIKKFNFSSIEDLIAWYFSTSYQIIEEKYSNPFHRKIILKTIKGMEIGLLQNIKVFKNENTTQA